MEDLGWLKYATELSINTFYGDPLDSKKYSNYFNFVGKTDNYNNLPRPAKQIWENVYLFKHSAVGYFNIFSSKPDKIIELANKYLDISKIKIAHGGLESSQYLVKFAEEIEKQKKSSFLRGLKVRLISDLTGYSLVSEPTDLEINHFIIGEYECYADKDTRVIIYKSGKTFFEYLSFAEKFNMDVVVDVSEIVVNAKEINAYLSSRSLSCVDG